METAFIVFVCFQSVFSFFSLFVIFKLLSSIRTIKRKQKQHYSVLCSIGNDTSSNFQKVFAFIEHELARQHVSDQQLPGSAL